MVVIDLNGMDIFLEYDQLVKHNPEVNWSIGIIWFIRYLKTYRTRHQNISFIPKYHKIQAKEEQDQGQQEIGKKPDLTNPEDLLDYIQLFIHLFNKKKFEKLSER